MTLPVINLAVRISTGSEEHPANSRNLNTTATHDAVVRLVDRALSVASMVASRVCVCVRGSMCASLLSVCVGVGVFGGTGYRVAKAEICLRVLSTPFVHVCDCVRVYVYV